MTARPPRASSRSEGKRAKSRGMTQGGADKRRAASIVPTDRFERVDDDQVVEELAVPGRAPADAIQVPRLRVAVLESAPHVAPAQGAIAAAGHTVVSALGRDRIDQLRPALGNVDALLVGMPGGEPLIDAALALGPQRPIVIAACSASAVDAARRAVAAGADLATVRPHQVERLAPVLLATARLIQLRDQLSAAAAPEIAAALDELSQSEQLIGEDEPEALQPLARFQQAVERELARAGRYAYPLTLAMFSVDLEPPPPPGVRGILRARAGNAIVHAIRDIDVATEIDQDRFLVLLPHTDRLAGAEIARRIIGAVASGDPVVFGNAAFAPRLIGAVAGARPGEPQAFHQLLHDATQLLEQAQVTGASLAVET